MPRKAPDRQQTSGIGRGAVTAAEKLHGVRFPKDAVDRLPAQMEAQLANVLRVREMHHSRDLQPALRFDPRIPGRTYPEQANQVRLKARGAQPLPDNDEDIAYASVVELSEWIGSGALTSERLVEIYLARIERYDSRLFSYITVTAQAARDEARERDAELAAGRRRGPLHGIPYGLKDVFDTAGVLTTWGSSLFKDNVPAEDATVVVKLREAGAVLLGKLGTGELANGSTWFGGDVRNPWNPDEPAGGSSSGPGSATAAALCAFAIGTDSAGSILNPADRCGVVGLRPTFGRVPVKGGMPLTPTLERIGPLCRRVEDAALVLAAINGPDPTSIHSFDWGFDYDADLDLKAIRIGWSPRWFERVGYSPLGGKPVAAGCLAALETLKGLGVTLVELDLPDLPYEALITNLMVEAATVFEDLTLDGRDDQLIAPWADSWRAVRLLSAVDYLQIERLRRRVMQVMDGFFEQADMLCLPTYGSFPLLLAANFTGHPGLSLRCGFEELATRGLDVVPSDPDGRKHRVTSNIALHGRLFEEGKMIAVARALEETLDVWGPRPSLS